MDFDSKLARIQGLIKYQQRIHGNLDNLKSGDSDDTEKLKSIKTEVLKCIKEGEFDEHDLRKLYFFLLLNTRKFEPQSSILSSDDDCGHLVTAIPVISDVLFVELVVALELDKFLYESIVSLPPILSLEVIDLVSILFKGVYKRNPFQLDCYPFQMIIYLEAVLKAVIVKLFLLDSISNQSLEIQGGEAFCITPFNEQFDSELCTDIKMKFYEHFESLMTNYTSAQAEDYKSLRKDRLNYLCACIMNSLIAVVKTCCQHYLNPAAVNEGSSINDIFKVTSFENNLKEKPKIPVIANIKETTLAAVITTFTNTAKSVSISLWMSWMELEKFTDKNMQMEIGNGFYHCLQYLNDEAIKNAVNNDLYSTFETVVTTMSIKPIDEEDEMETADFTTIMQNVNNPAKLQTRWMGLLISHQEFKPTLEILKVIEENSSVIVSNDAETLLFRSVEFLESASENADITPEICEHLKRNVFLAVSNCHIDHQMEILEQLLRKKGLTDILKLEGFEATMIELCNKTVEENDRIPFDVSMKFVQLALQSPKDLLDKIFSESKLNKAQGRFMTRLFGYLKPICIYQSDANKPSLLVSKVLEEIENANSMSDSEKENFLTFMFVDGTVIVANIPVSVPFSIISLCQVIDKFRWTLTEFDARSVAVCDRAIGVLICYADSLNFDSEEADEIEWMISELKQVDLLLQLHVINYVNHPKFNYLNQSKGKEIFWLKVMFLVPAQDLSFLDDDNKPMFSRVLMKALPYLTLNEWELMFGNLTQKEDAKAMSNLFLACADVFLMLHSSVVPNFVKEEFESNEVDSTYRCLSFVVKNLITILQNLILPVADRLKRVDVSDLFLKLCFILETFPRAVQENDEFVWLKILQDLIKAADLPKSHDATSDLTDSKRICTAISMIPHHELQTKLSEFIYSNIYSIEHKLVLPPYIKQFEATDAEIED
ncbi:uncharacterized protein LOC111050241 [Nilaparvata lugens]|uniref:uncharacterized protein LOC111050241 n=1 Tax=Nilaparvata lugens TaxID=108931 RepID=UPI00193EBCAB|nr:uncharacterized protein LOC111050241 [Nilaparvata lugens]